MGKVINNYRDLKEFIIEEIEECFNLFVLEEKVERMLQIIKQYKDNNHRIEVL